ncbi:T6PP_N domain-containing protein [Meloidogyne graminicola]|uniref:T6PP_N domain-containing protein n=1 Tax=Meloidogyne graminicola TaxID=189291 RepID=A0A8S9ZVG9_9BILA|nr:T6PP_N domain-containing protein [Meloidogyne graminicola]
MDKACQQNTDRQTRSDSVFSSIVDQQINWNDVFMRMDKHQGTVDDFKKLMYKVQSKRREFVSAFLHEYELTSSTDNRENTLFSSR